jgi:tRNA(Ile)-lysidine synthetase-like protein
MQKLIRQFKKEINIDFSKKLIVSVSGGVDSMVLMDFLRRLKLNIVIVHFNHQVRGQSIDEANMVRDYAEKYCLPFNYFKLDLNLTSDFQNKARNLRRKHLEDVAKRNQTPYIVTAHHLDDLLETILIKITRGSSLDGYSGMEQISQQGEFIYVKPFLYQQKEKFYSFAEEYDVPFMVDQSNFSDSYLRNRYRLALVPIMKQENENLLTQIEQYSKQVSAAYKFIRKNTLEFVKDSPNLNIPKFKKLDQAIQDDVIAYYLELNGINLNFRLIEKIRKVLLSKKPNQTVYLSNKYQLVKFYEKAEIKPRNEIYFKKIKASKELSPELEFFYSTKRSTSKAITIKLSYDEIKFPLWARTREDGDILSYDYGTKKLKKLLIDSKVPMEERDKLVVITDDNNKILWIPNYYVNHTLGSKNSIYLSVNEETN